VNDKPGAASLRRTETILNQKGLHARAAARFAETVALFDADISVTKDGQTVSGKSIMGLMMLAASPGSTIDIEASGTDAEAVLNALSGLIQTRFGED